MNGYIVAAALSLVISVTAYFGRFFIHSHFEFPTDPGVWGNFGSYVGGILGPAFSFISLFFIVKTLKLQNEANESLRKQTEENKKLERFRSFSTLFFQMIDSQKSLMKNLEFDIKENGSTITHKEVKAFLKIEKEVKFLRSIGASDYQIRRYLNQIDESDQIYSMVRTFYISVRMVSEKLSDKDGFSQEDRADLFVTLINFTEFSQLRLILMGIQFLNYPATTSIKKVDEFNSVLTTLGLSLDLY